MMKNFLKAGWTGLLVTLLSLCVGIEGRDVRGKTTTPTSQTKPVTPRVTPNQLSRPKSGAKPAWTKEDPEIVSINKSVKIINNQEDCNLSNWNNNSDDACQCGLSYRKDRFGDEESADQIIDHCINTSKQCTQQSIQNIKKKYNAQNMSSEDFLNTLYKDTTVVNEVTFNYASLGPKGALTEDLLATILVDAYNAGTLTQKEFSKKECLKIKSLGSGSGYNTAQLFLATSTCIPSQQFLYIVKESKKGLTESTNLKKIEEYPGMKELTGPAIKKDFPTIALPFFYFSYHPKHQNVHYIATMPAADGMVFCSLIGEFRDNKSPENAERLKKAYRILGKELSNFHKHFMRPVAGKKLGVTVAHGDLHCHNIFYDEKMGHFTFIDNETMVKSFGALRTPVIDFIRLIFPPFSTDKTIYEFKELITGVKPGTYLNITLKPFLNGYLSAYEAQDRKQLLEDLRKIFTGKIQAHPLHFDPQYIQTLINENINPIFDEIAKTLK